MNRAEQSRIEATHANWIGKRVSIRGVGGFLAVETKDSKTSVKTVNTVDATTFDVVQVPPRPGQETSTTMVAFRVVDEHNSDPKFLSIVMYGDGPRQDLLETLASRSPLIPDIISNVVDFTVDRSTEVDNFEGQGYNYASMTAQPGPPNMLQMFQMEEVAGGRIGIKTVFNTYWRSQHWDGTVSQSPTRNADELWYLSNTANRAFDTMSRNRLTSSEQQR